MSCAVPAPDNTEVTREELLSIGSLPKPRKHDAIKGVVSPIQGRRDGIQWWRLREPMGESEDEQRRVRNKEDPENAGTLLHSQDRSRNQDPCGPDTEPRTAGPGEHTSEPATLQGKRGHARYGILGQGGRRGDGKREKHGESTKSTGRRRVGKKGCKESERQIRGCWKAVSQRSLS
ncbi:hypothetical protein NDU88_001138 [Pleurodeles waltl]|uniref:Uncharacterized protein n=1 Tax=Pleurodeles waltl TaxID=8319 RepID=A0AAV7PAA6_PLEWA|nr:hypothetical protein NDU88_001138 [Pleurodeles waltl]